MILRGGLSGGRQVLGDVPRKQLLDAVDGVGGDSDEHMAQVGFRIQSIHLRRLDETIQDSRLLSSVVGTGDRANAFENRLNH